MAWPRLLLTDSTIVDMKKVRPTCRYLIDTGLANTRPSAFHRATRDLRRCRNDANRLECG